MALRVVDLFQIRVVRDRFDSLLLWNHLIVASHDHHGSEFQTLGKMHSADRGAAAGGFHVVVEHFVRDLRILDRCTSAVELGRGANEDADLVRYDSLLGALDKPLATRAAASRVRSSSTCFALWA
jgi:hypothetical protein